jgi:hypothetical protein
VDLRRVRDGARKRQGSVNEINLIGDLARLDLRPGDTLVLMAERIFSADQRSYLTQRMREHFPQHEVLILDGGAKLAAVRPDPDQVTKS